MIHIVVTGSECTGKTTLAKGLAEHYGTVWVPEFVCGYVDEKGAPPSYEDVEPVARGQLALRAEKVTHASCLLFHDTDLLSTVVYSHHYYGECPRWIEEALDEGAVDLYLLADIDIPWLPDGNQRDRGARREEMHALFREALIARGTKFAEVRGLGRERLVAAVSQVDYFLG